jgi:uncharacterized protein YjgD (DUF1641 family)
MDTPNELYDLILGTITQKLVEHKLSFSEALHVLNAVKDDLIVSHFVWLDKRVESLEKLSREKLSDEVDKAIN